MYHYASVVSCGGFCSAFNLPKNCNNGKPSKGKKRYLPDAAWDALSSSEKAATNKAKAKGNAKGKQFVAQPKKIASKTSKYR